MAIPRAVGQLRLEVESRYRDSYKLNAPTNGLLTGSFSVGDNWSMLANACRDIPLTEQVGLYAGGGIGGGGYSMDYDVSFLSLQLAGKSQIATFAWQAGGGVMYALGERVTLDLGYRFCNVLTTGQMRVLYEPRRWW